MRLLEFNNFTGAKEWSWVDPDSKHVYQGSSMQDLVSKIKGYREQNGLEPIEYLQATIEDYLCKKPVHSGACHERGKLKRGLIPTIRGGMVLIRSMLFKRFVSQEVADERGAICVKCPNNVFPDKGAFVKWSDELAQDCVGDRKSKWHDQLGNCDLCTCSMRSKVWIGEEFTISAEENMGMKEVGCWQPDVAKVV